MKKRTPPAAGMGRPKGTPNKVTRDLKAMILGALDEAGGQSYLAAQAQSNPGPFMTLLGKVLPTTLAGSVTVKTEPREMSEAELIAIAAGPAQLAQAADDDQATRH